MEVDAVQFFKGFGLTDREIVAMSLVLYDGNSFREAGEILGISHVSVHRFCESAQKKLEKAGIPRCSYERTRMPKTHRMDPGLMDKVFTFDQRYAGWGAKKVDIDDEIDGMSNGES